MITQPLRKSETIVYSFQWSNGWGRGFNVYLNKVLTANYRLM